MVLGTSDEAGAGHASRESTRNEGREEWSVGNGIMCCNKRKRDQKGTPNRELGSHGVWV